jgi:hypothetical protein
MRFMRMTSAGVSRDIQPPNTGRQGAYWDGQLIDRARIQRDHRVGGPMRTRTVTLLLLAALLFLAGCDPEPIEPEAAPSPKPARSHTGYFLQMPLHAVAPDVGSPGGAIINVTSNLPDATLAYVTTHIPGRGQETLRHHKFVAGTLKIHQIRYCVSETDIDLARGFDVQVIVVPDISLIAKSHGPKCKSLTDCGFGLQQRSVQETLGPNFERLAGDSVTTIFGTRALVEWAHYAWPEGSCGSALDFASGTPRICPPSTASINEDEGGANVEAVGDSIAILMRQNRFCDLYNFTTDGFRSAVSWSEFRGRILRWSKRPTFYAISGGAVKKGTPETIGVVNSPAFLVVGYNIWGKTAAYARFVAHAGPTGHTKWEIAELDLR